MWIIKKIPFQNLQDPPYFAPLIATVIETLNNNALEAAALTFHSPCPFAGQRPVPTPGAM